MLAGIAIKDGISVPLSDSSPKVKAGAARIASRYVISLAGPLSVSAAHFVASIIIFRTLSAFDFGLFSFAVVITSFCFSLSGALLVAPMASIAADARAGEPIRLQNILTVNVVFAGLAAMAVTALLLISGASFYCATAFGVYGAFMCVRWVARGYSYARSNPKRVTICDIIYAATLTSGLIAVGAFGKITSVNVALIMLAASAAALLSCENAYLRDQVAAIIRPTLSGYGNIWRDMTRWSLLGAVTTELSSNAHAYIVTLYAGPGAFGLLAIGALLMRPINLTMKSLGEVECAPMAVHLKKGDYVLAARIAKEFHVTGMLCWVATVFVSAAIIYGAPQLLQKGIYSRMDVIAVAGVWLAIMFIRVYRAPQSAMLQAAKEFRPLAGASLVSSFLSLAMTFGFLVTLGPVMSLCGVLVSDAVMTVHIMVLATRLKQRFI